MNTRAHYEIEMYDKKFGTIMHRPLAVDRKNPTQIYYYPFHSIPSSKSVSQSVNEMHANFCAIVSSFAISHRDFNARFRISISMARI